MDIKIDTPNEHFKFRVVGIVEHNNKYLVVKIADNNFYCLPGGHAEIGEDTETAILREMQEELGYTIKIKRLAGIAQNLFKGKNDKNFHEFSYYYIVEPENKENVNPNDYEIIENDKGEFKKLVFKWLTLEEFRSVDFRPNFAKELLTQNKLLHVINKYDKEVVIDELTFNK